MKLSSFLCCEIAIQDVRSNTISLINMMEEISAVAFPAAVPKLTVALLFEKSTAEQPSTVAFKLKVDLKVDSSLLRMN